MSGLLDFLNPVTDVVNVAKGLISQFVQDPNQKAQVELQLVQAQTAFQQKVLDAQTAMATQQANVIVAEAKSESWAARNWRPILMLTFTFIIAWDYIFAPLFHIATLAVPEQMWSLIEIGVGGYIIGRSAEKIAPSVTQALKSGSNGPS